MGLWQYNITNVCLSWAQTTFNLKATSDSMHLITTIVTNSPSQLELELLPRGCSPQSIFLKSLFWVLVGCSTQTAVHPTSSSTLNKLRCELIFKMETSIFLHLLSHLDAFSTALFLPLFSFFLNNVLHMSLFQTWTLNSCQFQQKHADRLYKWWCMFFKYDEGKNQKSKINLKSKIVMKY